ncbi:MAG TPA: hypothetical protein VMJ75_13500 [Candidatus Acidoferrales bacterium]|nr:hypothetical protein [Candidatus Acidoferrales bacterium]
MPKWIWIAPALLLATGCSRNPEPVERTAAATQPGATGGGRGSAPAPPAATTAAADATAGAPSTSAAAGAARPGESAEPAAPVRQPIVIPNGTPLHVRLDHELDTKRNRAGDRFTASLSEPLAIAGSPVLPVGTRFTGHVTSAGASGRLKGRAEIGLTLDSFEYQGQRYEIHTTSVDRVSASHAKRNGILIGGGTGLGTALGAIAGGPKGALIGAGVGAAAGTAGAAATGKREVAIPAEAVLRFTLRKSIEI